MVIRCPRTGELKVCGATKVNFQVLCDDRWFVGAGEVMNRPVAGLVLKVHEGTDKPR